MKGSAGADGALDMKFFPACSLNDFHKRRKDRGPFRGGRPVLGVVWW